MSRSLFVSYIQRYMYIPVYMLFVVCQVHWHISYWSFMSIHAYVPLHCLVHLPRKLKLRYWHDWPILILRPCYLFTMLIKPAAIQINYISDRFNLGIVQAFLLIFHDVLLLLLGSQTCSMFNQSLHLNVPHVHVYMPYPSNKNWPKRFPGSC